MDKKARKHAILMVLDGEDDFLMDDNEDDVVKTDKLCCPRCNYQGDPENFRGDEDE